MSRGGLHIKATALQWDLISGNKRPNELISLRKALQVEG
jgi:hypothetical protein